MKIIRIQVARLLIGLVLLCLLLQANIAAPAHQNSPTPKEAWAKLKEHGNDVKRLRYDYDPTVTRLQEIMRHAGSGFADDRQRLLDFRTLILDHYDTVYTVWHASQGGAMSNVLRNAHRDFDDLDRMKARFLDLAKQMATKRTPQSEREFLNYLKIFSGKLKDLDQNHFDWMYKRFSKFAAECGQHGDTVRRFSDPTQRALDAYATKFRPAQRGSSQQRFDQEMNQYRQQRADFFNFLATWDAKQASVVAAADVIKNDWRRIHEDTKRMAEFLDNPNFIKDLPDIDAQIVVDTFPRIRGYLDTYK